MSDYDGDHLRHVKRGKTHNNPAESSNLRFAVHDELNFPVQQTPSFLQNGGSGRNLNINSNQNQNQNYATNPNPSSGIRGGVPRRMQSSS